MRATDSPGKTHDDASRLGMIDETVQSAVMPPSCHSVFDFAVLMRHLCHSGWHLERKGSREAPSLSLPSYFILGTLLITRPSSLHCSHGGFKGGGGPVVISGGMRGNGVSIVKVFKNALRTALRAISVQNALDFAYRYIQS